MDLNKGGNLGEEWNGGVHYLEEEELVVAEQLRTKHWREGELGISAKNKHTDRQRRKGGGQLHGIQDKLSQHRGGGEMRNEQSSYPPLAKKGHFHIGRGRDQQHGGP